MLSRLVCQNVRRIQVCSISPRLDRRPAQLSQRPYATAQAQEVIAPKEPPSIVLRDYQEQCIKSVLDSLAEGKKRLGVSLATGSGKTVIFTHLIDRVKGNKGAAKTLILAHRRELIEQASRHCSLAYPNKSVEVDMGTVKASGDADITVASIQSLQSAMRIEKFRPSEYKLILVDEAHHIVAPGYLKALEHFGLYPLQKNAPALVGVSATWARFDGLQLGKVIDHIVYHKDYTDMIKENWLCDLSFTTVKIAADLSKVARGANGEFTSSSLSQAMNTRPTNEIIVRTWLSHAEGRKSTLVFAVDVAHVKSLTEVFASHGVVAKNVTGSTPLQERSRLLDDFRSGKFPVLINCSVFTEGTDVPNIDCVLLARPTASRNLLVQMIGRGMRLHAGKKDCHVIDMVSTLKTGIVTTPTLFGLDPRLIVSKVSSKDLEKMKDKQLEEAPLTIEPDFDPNVKLKFDHYASILDLLEDSSGERYVRGLSRLAWVAVGNDKYVLSGNDGSYLMIEPFETSPNQKKTEMQTQNPSQSKPNYQIRYNAKVTRTPGAGEWRPYRRTQIVGTAHTFENIIHAADTFASSQFARHLILAAASWRKLPATSGQLDFLNKFRDEVSKLTEDDITKGDAVSMITKIKHGARGRLAAIKVAERKRAVEKDRLENMRSRVSALGSQVRVGPLAG